MASFAVFLNDRSLLPRERDIVRQRLTRPRLGLPAHKKPRAGRRAVQSFKVPLDEPRERDAAGVLGTLLTDGLPFRC